MLNNKSILITGGTGSFGKKFTEIALSKFKPKKVFKLIPVINEPAWVISFCFNSR